VDDFLDHAAERSALRAFAHVGCGDSSALLTDITGVCFCHIGSRGWKLWMLDLLQYIRIYVLFSQTCHTETQLISEGENTDMKDFLFIQDLEHSLHHMWVSFKTEAALKDAEKISLFINRENKLKNCRITLRLHQVYAKILAEWTTQ
jgi:hypothetical protein